jgi:hypothetical protein
MFRMATDPNGRVRTTGLILKQRQVASRSLRNAAHAALLLPFLLLGCSALSLPKEDVPTAGPDPTYNKLVADHIKGTFKDYASYDAFEISEYRWVHSTSGWSWLTCVRFQDKARRLTYAVYIKQKEIIDNRYAVATDGCGAQTYSTFALVGGTKSLANGSLLEPLY